MSSLSKTLNIVQDNVTAANLKLLYTELVSMRSNKDFLIKNLANSKAIISKIIYFVVEAEKTSRLEISELFCELNFTNEFILLADLDDHSINLTIIETFSFLFVNLSDSMFSYYILSNNFINLLISRDFSAYDENFFSYYINFIKSLALRINHSNIQFFFQTNVNSFPIVQCAINLYNYNDAMIRTCVRAILLTILGIKYEPIQDYFTQLPSVEYFIYISLHLRDLVYQLDNEKMGSNTTNWVSIYEDIIDEIRYIKDILNLHLENINYVLINLLYSYLILPVLCKSLTTLTQPKISKEISLIILKAFLDNIPEESFSNILYIILFADKQPKGLEYFSEVIPDNKYYWSNWTLQEKHPFTFLDLVCRNYTPGFFVSLIYENSITYKINKKYPQLQEIQEKIKIDCKNNIAITNQKTEEMIHEYFLLDDYKTMKDYHHNVSSSIGKNVGLLQSQNKITELYDPSFLSIMLSFVSSGWKVEKRYSSKTLLNDNEIKKSIFSYINSKDNDSLRYFSNLLLYAGIKKNVSSMFELTTSKFSPVKVKLIKFQSIVTNGIKDKMKPNVIDSKEMNQNSVILPSINEAFLNSNCSEIKVRPHNELIDKLLKSSDFSLRLLTSELIIINITNIPKDISKKYSKTELAPQITFIIKQIYFQIISQIKESIKASYTIRENGFEYFKQQWVEYSSKANASQMNSQKEKPYNLIPSHLVNPVKDYLQVFKNKSNDIETFKYYLIMFMKLYDLRILLLNQTNKKKLINAKFPLDTNVVEFELEQLIILKSLKAKAIIQDAQLKMNNTDNVISVVTIVYSSFIYFGSYDELQKGAAKIMYKYALRNVSIHNDPNDQKCLNVLVIDNIKVLELKLQFQTVEITREFNWQLSDRKLAVINNEKMFFYMYFQEMEEK